MNSFDARVRYTRMIIEQSFLELLRDKPFAKITVTELCEKAQINRATFYKHYLDIPDLLEKIEETLFDQIRESFGSEKVKLKEFLIKMMYYTRENQSRYMALGGDHGDPNLMAKTFLVCYESAYPLVEQNMPNLKESERKMLYHFLSQGAGGILTWWIKDGMRESPEDVAQFILGVCSMAADGVQTTGWKEQYKE